MPSERERRSSLSQTTTTTAATRGTLGRRRGIPGVRGAVRPEIGGGDRILLLGVANRFGAQRLRYGRAGGRPGGRGRRYDGTVLPSTEVQDPTDRGFCASWASGPGTSLERCGCATLPLDSGRAFSYSAGPIPVPTPASASLPSAITFYEIRGFRVWEIPEPG